MPNRSDRRLSRWTLGAAAGVLGAVLPMVGLSAFPIWRFPDTSRSGAQISSFVHAHQPALQVLMVLNTVGVSLWMVFGAALWTRLREAARDDDPLPACFAFGLVGLVTLVLAGFSAFDVLVLRTPGPSEARLLYDVTFGLLAMSGMPTAIALGAYALGNLRGGLLPRSTGVLAALAAAAHVVLLLSFVVPRGFFSLEGQVITVVPGLLFVWILATGLAMLRDDVTDCDT